VVYPVLRSITEYLAKTSNLIALLAISKFRDYFDWLEELTSHLAYFPWSICIHHGFVVASANRGLQKSELLQPLISKFFFGNSNLMIISIRGNFCVVRSRKYLTNLFHSRTEKIPDAQSQVASLAPSHVCTSKLHRQFFALQSLSIFSMVDVHFHRLPRNLRT
jgi:hypothetical protein